MICAALTNTFGSSQNVKWLLWPIVAERCWMGIQDGTQRWACPGPRACGPEELDCGSEWPLRVQCDGQPRAAHTGSLCQSFLGSLSLSHTHSVIHVDTFIHTSGLTSGFFFSSSHLVMLMWQAGPLLYALTLSL